MGSIFKKLRGLNAVNRAYLEILLNGGGLRVVFGKTQGLFSKMAMAEGVPSNLGHWIQIQQLEPDLTHEPVSRDFDRRISI
jgi:hypothetical protein